jgi:PilZ domain
MALAGWVRDRLWRADHWCAELAQLRQSVAAEPRTPATPQRVYDLARATEYCDPDRGRAVALYLDAWRGGHADARDRAKALAVALRAHMTLAEIALGEGDLVAAGAAFLDAGLPELAVEPLQRFVEARPPGSSAATENVRLAGVKALLALAGRQRFDAEREIATTLAHADHETGRAAAAAYVHAARIARLANLGDRLAGILATAGRACPDDDEIAALVEARVVESGDADAVLEHYRLRFERSPTRQDYVRRVGAAAVELIGRNFQPGLGLRLLRMSLEDGYAANLPESPAHLAAWELMTTHARAQRSTLDLVPLIVKGLSAPLSEDGALFLARLGLEIAWRDASDTLAAQPYAAMVLDYLPDHPLATAFVTEVSPETLSTSPARPATPAATPPAAPRTPAPAPAPAPTPPAPATAPTSRIPTIDQGQVKRAAVPASAVPAHGVTSRLALLKPPPPRATSLKRDTSPFPIAQRPATAPAPRAPRKVVPVDVVVELSNGAFFSTVLRDVSTSGAFIVTKRQLEVGTIVSLDLRIPVPNTITQANHRTNARIARRTEVGCGLAFIDPPPELVAALRAATE